MISHATFDLTAVAIIYWNLESDIGPTRVQIAPSFNTSATFPRRKEGFAMRVSYAIVFVSDMKRSVSFYRDVIGLPLKFESPGWTEFATEGATLALHASRAANPDKDNPQELPAGRCRPGLHVPNLDDFHKRMIERNVRCLQEPKDVFGARVAQYVDPDGLALSVGEERGVTP